MEKTKEFYTYRLGLGVTKWLNENKKQAKLNKQNKIEDINLVKSEGDLAASSGVSKNAISEIKLGRRNPEYTTIEFLAEGLGVPLSTLILYCENIPDEEIFKGMGKIPKRKR